MKERWGVTWLRDIRQALCVSLHTALGKATVHHSPKPLGLYWVVSYSGRVRKPPSGLRGDDLIAHYATLKLPPLVGIILNDFIKRLNARLFVRKPWAHCFQWGCQRQIMPLSKLNEDARFGCHAEDAVPQRLHQVLMRFQLDCWELEANHPNGREL